MRCFLKQTFGLIRSISVPELAPEGGTVNFQNLTSLFDIPARLAVDFLNVPVLHRAQVVFSLQEFPLPGGIRGGPRLASGRQPCKGGQNDAPLDQPSQLPDISLIIPLAQADVYKRQVWMRSFMIEQISVEDSVPLKESGISTAFFMGVPLLMGPPRKSV